MKHLAIRYQIIATLFTCFAISMQSYAEIQPSVNTESVSVDFQQNNWQLVCDNTRTCRAVGYQDIDSKNNAVALLLKRQAGVNQRVRAYVKFEDGSMSEEVTGQACGSPDKITLSINDKSYGEVTTDASLKLPLGGAWELTTDQTNALINTLPAYSKIVFSYQCQRYVVSDKGSTAVLLKMDEVQGRVGTKGAIVKRGDKPISSVLPAIAKPVIHAVSINDAKMKQASDKALFKQLKSKMTDLVLPTLSQDDKEAFDVIINPDNPDYSPSTGHYWEFYRLNDKQLLAERLFWTGAYNVGYGYWVMNDTAPYDVKLVTTDGSEYYGGVIFASHKGRGLGDCFFSESWHWTGKAFRHSSEYSTGLCRGVALGGAFELPLLITTIIE